MQEYAGDYLEQELNGKIVDFGSGIFNTRNLGTFEKVQIHTMAQAFDLGFSEKKTSDYSAYALCGIGTDGKFYIIDIERWRFKAPITKEKIRTIKSQVPDMPTMIEANGPQKAVYDDLVSDGVRDLIPVVTTSSKVARSVGFASAIEKGNVLMKAGKTWNNEFKEECDEFSLDDSHAHDDMVDAVVMCYNYLKYGNSGGIRTYNI